MYGAHRGDLLKYANFSVIDVCGAVCKVFFSRSSTIGNVPIRGRSIGIPFLFGSRDPMASCFLSSWHCNSFTTSPTINRLPRGDHCQDSDRSFTSVSTFGATELDGFSVGLLASEFDSQREVVKELENSVGYHSPD